ncbi:MAG: hypothetical protein ACKOAS_07935 [Verrucomicrobiota bacterium]
MTTNRFSNPDPVPGEVVRVPFTGCDAYFLAVEQMMERAGQGRHVGLSVAELGGGFDIGRLEDAARRFSMSHPLLHARIAPRGIFGVPEWIAEPPFGPEAAPVFLHPEGTELQELCERLLADPQEAFFQLHIVPREGGHWLVARWFHLLFDGRGAELALEEIARLAENSGEPAALRASWGIPFTPPAGLLERLRHPQAFVDRHYEMKPFDFGSLGGSRARAGVPGFRVVRFSLEESARIRERAEEFTGGIFHLPFFFAAATRAHAAVFRKRGAEPASYYSPAPVQARKRWMRHPIFQNQVTVLFFKVTAREARDFRTAVVSLQAQFDRSVRAGVEHSFATMLWWMRRLPVSLYRRFLLADTGGELTSFFQSHTGEFMGGTRSFCGAEIRNGWHIPTVSQPPGSGVFFNDHRGRLNATISWREGTLAESEIETMVESLRSDLTGN